jgi:hypothetical protein
VRNRGSGISTALADKVLLAGLLDGTVDDLARRHRPDLFCGKRTP